MTDVETRYTEQVPLMRRRALGQFFTPPALARLMARWCLADGGRTLLDPAVGTGLLVREALRVRPLLRVTACDNDPVVLAACAATLPATVDLRCADFLTDFPDERYEAIISNPPYLGYKSLPYPESIFAFYDQLCGIRINRQSNLYVLFILAIARRLSLGGRASILVPSDWLNGNFGTPLKAYLLREQLLDGLIVFDPNDTIFGDSLATACLLLLRRGRQEAPIRFAYLCRPPSGDETDLDQFIAQAGAVACYKPGELDPERKWLPLLPLPAARRVSTAEAAAGFVPVGQLASVKRGIATGANDFFVLSREQARSAALPPSLFKLCLSRASHAPLADITSDDIAGLLERNSKVLLLDPPPGELPPSLEQYLQYGVSLGVDRRYLPAHRRPWYRVEQRQPAPILVTTFARGAVRFIFNRLLLAHLTAFHGITLHADLRSEDWVCERALLSYLLTPHASSALRAQQRLLGAGLHKWEPADIAQVLVPDLRRFCPGELAELAALFDRHCLELRANHGRTALQELDRCWSELLRRM